MEEEKWKRILNQDSDRVVREERDIKRHLLVVEAQ